MVKEAESHVEEDRRRKELVEAKNQAEQLIYTADRTLTDLGDKVSSDEKAKIESAKAELSQARQGDDLETIKDKMDALSTSLHTVTSRMYAQANPGSEADHTAHTDHTGHTEGPGGEKVVDADYEVVDDDDSDK
jgi:molecular chaperone DnaK